MILTKVVSWFHGVATAKFLKVRRAAVTLKNVLATTLGIMFMSYIYPEAITAIQSVNTTAWTFTGHAGAAALWGLVALVGIAGFIGMIAGRN